MKAPFSLRRLLVPCALVAATASCMNTPTLESIRYGYSASRVAAQAESPIPDDYNDMAAGWAPERPGSAETPLYGFDGSPVGANQPGTITETNKPINSGVDPEPTGSRGTLLNLYTAAAENVQVLTTRNEDLQMGMDRAENRAYDLDQQLKALQAAYDTLGGEMQAVQTQNQELAGRLATAQIARLEAERALLEATLEWRRMSAENNKPLTGQGERRQRP